jgi:hypothetical protein
MAASGINLENITALGQGDPFDESTGIDLNNAATAIERAMRTASPEERVLIATQIRNTPGYSQIAMWQDADKGLSKELAGTPWGFLKTLNPVGAISLAMKKERAKPTAAAAKRIVELVEGV